MPPKSRRTPLATTAERRYVAIADHIERVSRYAELIGRQLGFDAGHAALVRGATKLHDIGKIAIPDRILLKPGALTPAERAIIERHAAIGHQLLDDPDSELLTMAATVALSHHERWDGLGYPHGLAGAEIPIEARIAAVADVCDSLIRMRTYRPSFRIQDAIELVRAGRGTQFDSEVVDAFDASLPGIRRVRRLRPRVAPPV
jgi:putative two-component system response regulator